MTQSDSPLVSVIVRSMDRSTLADALASLAKQTYPNIEVLVVNAHGGAHAPLPDCGDRPVMRLIEPGAPLGRGRAANAGLDAAHGDYVAFLDDDDTVDPDHYAELVTALRRENDRVVAYAGVRCMDRGDPAHKVSRVVGEPFAARAKLLAGNFIPIHAPLIPRRLLATGARFDETLDVYEDWDFWLQLAEHAPFLYTGRVTATYFMDGASGVSPAARDAQAVASATQAIYAKWKDRITADELKTLGDLYRYHEAEVRRLSDVAAELTTRLQDSEARLAAKEQEVAGLYASTSWKITAPLRWCGKQWQEWRARWRGS